MTHDWFSHLEEGHNAPEYMTVGCATQTVNGVDTPLTPDDVAKLGCRPGDQIDRAFVADSAAPANVHARRREYLTRAPKVLQEHNTAWWDASQIYGYDDVSRKRVKRDPADRARLLMVAPPSAKTAGDRRAICRCSQPPIRSTPDWAGQEADGLPGQLDHRDELLPQRVRARAQSVRRRVPRVRGGSTPMTIRACAIRRKPDTVIRYRDVTPDELFELGAPGRRRRDRQDPHHRMDAAAAVRRAAVPRHECQLERACCGTTRAIKRAARRCRRRSLGKSQRREQVANSGTRCSPRAPASSGSGSRRSRELGHLE